MGRCLLVCTVHHPSLWVRLSPTRACSALRFARPLSQLLAYRLSPLSSIRRSGCPICKTACHIIQDRALCLRWCTGLGCAGQEGLYCARDGRQDYPLILSRPQRPMIGEYHEPCHLSASGRTTTTGGPVSLRPRYLCPSFSKAEPFRKLCIRTHCEVHKRLQFLPHEVDIGHELLQRFPCRQQYALEVDCLGCSHLTLIEARQ